MNSDYRYRLEKGNKKYYCPKCGKKTFVLYTDGETGRYLPDHYGRCDRECNCSYHLNPYKDGYAKMIWKQEQDDYSEFPNYWEPKKKKVISKPATEPVHFDFNTFNQTLNNYEQNEFIHNLLYNVPFPFKIKDIEDIIAHYYLGTITKGYKKGAITFPFIDINNNVRAIQVKQFDETNHTIGTDFLHTIIGKHYTRINKPQPEWLKGYSEQDKKVSCLFGEHLLNKYPNNPIALVEAPKTAIYGSLYFGLPETLKNLIWLAVYNKSSFSFDKLKILKGREVYVFPDLSKDGGTFNEWKNKAQEFENRLPETRFTFSHLLENLAPEIDRIEGKDLADYLIELDWREFRSR